jgi:hypothetical protein
MRKCKGSTRVLILIMSMAGFLTLPGCAKLCGDTGTREGAWGLVFRCTSSNRTESHYTVPAGIRVP